MQKENLENCEALGCKLIVFNEVLKNELKSIYLQSLLKKLKDSKKPNMENR